MKTFIAIFLLLTSFTAHAEKTPLSVYLWEDTLSPRVIEQWETHNNYSIELSHFDNDDERSLLMMKNVQLPFDLVILDNVSAQIYGRQGIFEDLTALPNRSNNDTRWNQACGTHAVPYFWGSVGIVYRKDLVAHAPNTWDSFVHPPKELEGKIGMINDSVESFLPVFYSLGLNPTTEDTQEIQSAYPELKRFSDQALTFEYVLSYLRSQNNPHELYMALGYSGDQHSLNRFTRSDHWGFVIPEGELFIWVDCLAVSSHSQHKQAAKAFINYLLDPNIAVKNAIDIKAATPNLRALKLMPDWYLNDASLFPGPERVESAQIDSELSAQNLSLRTKIINRLIKSHETQH